MRRIVHLDIPDFHATLQELKNPELKRRPLVLAEPGPQAVILGINGVARSEGLREGMPLSQARRLCRRLVAVAPDPQLFKDYHQGILGELDRFSPLVEGPFPGRYFVDLTGTRRLWGPEPDVACRIERRLSERQGLHARVGLASSKLISQVAAACITPGDLSCIFPGAETSFLAPLPVSFLPGVGMKTAARLADFNIGRIGELAAIPAESLAGVFGGMAMRLLKIARGVDPTPVVPFRKAPRLCVVNNLDRDEIDRDRLAAILFQQVEEAGWVLRSHNRCPGKVAIEVQYADGMTVRGRRPLPSDASHADPRLYEMVLAAFDQLVQRRIAIRRVALEFSDFLMPLRQMSLFPWEERSLRADRDLQQTLDGIRRRFGRHSITWGRAAADSTVKVTVELPERGEIGGEDP